MQLLSRHALLIAAVAIGAGAFTATPAHAAAQVVTSPPPAPAPVANEEPEDRKEDPPATRTRAEVGEASRVRQPPGIVCGPPYVMGDQKLGPKYLPKTGVIGRILRGYVPFGGLSPQKFLYRYFNQETGFYRFPPDFGFAHAGGWPNAKPLVSTRTLPVGMLVDRFGGEGGAFLAPFGTPYVERGLPPSNLNTFSDDKAHVCNYHVYRVMKEFKVDAGPTSRAFQMWGQGRQYHTLAKHIQGAPPSNSAGELAIAWLADPENGYLKRVN
ncbi:TNT domain-containing protein [Acrocarpospora catenulata]|uniref:TNT domain-containing protein n=1 Tax=Acrocarpospora catenulata TaxID=2836182 RepID=UPI001BD953FE|nr:TNT domain-containing protein [Acrocarpospora catenulata]